MKFAGNVNLAFISCRICNWKDASEKQGGFNIHKRSKVPQKCTRTRLELMIMLSRTTMDIREMLLSTYSEQKKGNRVPLGVIQKCAVLSTVCHQEEKERKRTATLFSCFTFKVRTTCQYTSQLAKEN